MVTGLHGSLSIVASGVNIKSLSVKLAGRRSVAGAGGDTAVYRETDVVYTRCHGAVSEAAGLDAAIDNHAGR